MGRGPLDEEAIRLIEANNPDIRFDWTRILKGQADPDDEPAPGRDAGRERERRGPERDSRARPVPPPEPAAALAAPVDEPTTAAHTRVGSEGLARLRARYSEMLARIGERIADIDAQSELTTLAERLNPDAWVTDADVTAGLESYEATFATLRGALGHRRPRKDESGPAPG